MGTPLALAAATLVFTRQSLTRLAQMIFETVREAGMDSDAKTITMMAHAVSHLIIVYPLVS